MRKTLASVFVSHAVFEREIVLKLVGYLQVALPNVAFYVSSSYKSLKPGAAWWDDVRSTLAEAKVVLACVSRQSVNKPWILFESGVGVGNKAVVIPVILDDLPYSGLGTPLSMYQSVHLDKDGLLNLVRMIAKETKTRSDLARLTYKSIPTFSELSAGKDASSGIYLGATRITLSGWVSYAGSAGNIYESKEYISLGNSFDDGFRYPPSDSLEAPWRFWCFRIKRTKDVHIYASVRCVDGSTHIIYVSSNANAWGFAFKWLDEFLVPAPSIPKDKWQVVIVNMTSLEHKLESPIRSIAGFRVRGPLTVSHMWCVDDIRQVPKKFTRGAIQLIYPGGTL